ncbi:hypothetical protein PT974_04652 [Cladobotryum mycophilum]|uniref:Uncharacterized protein n=1 Tax=Cladobotryum mycophilum TaxID=491253 RepID=A0ABR0SVM7_9HYPO
MPKKGPSRKPLRTNDDLEHIAAKGAKEKNRAGAWAYNNAQQPAPSRPLRNGAGDRAEQVLESDVGGTNTASREWEISGVNTEMPPQQSLGIPRTSSYSIGPSSEIRTACAPLYTDEILPLGRQIPAGVPQPDFAFLDAQGGTDIQPPLPTYPVSVRSANNNFESAYTIFNSFAPQSAISRAFLRIIGIGTRPVPPGNRLRFPARTPAGLIQPEEFATIEIQSIRYGINPIILTLVVLNDESLTRQIDLFLGGRVLERFGGCFQSLSIVGSLPYTPEIAMNDQENLMTVPDFTGELMPLPLSWSSPLSFARSQTATAIASGFDPTRRPQPNIGPNTLISPSWPRQGQMLSSNLLPISSQQVEALAISLPSGAASTAESIFSSNGISLQDSIGYTEEPSDSAFVHTISGQSLAAMTTSHVADGVPPLGGDVINVPMITIDGVSPDFGHPQNLFGLAEEW